MLAWDLEAGNQQIGSAVMHRYAACQLSTFFLLFPFDLRIFSPFDSEPQEEQSRMGTGEHEISYQGSELECQKQVGGMKRKVTAMLLFPEPL